MKYFQVAIDGPVGAGKSTVARLVAREAGFIYVDTGAMYRAAACKAMDSGAGLEDERTVVEAVGGMRLDVWIEDGVQRVSVDGRDLTDEIRSPAASMGASAVAKYKGVREKLVAIQKNLARCNNVVMDGRDIGTHVLKNAQVKIYLDASVDERARRRFDELSGKGVWVGYEDVRKDVIKRDFSDSSRDESPLAAAEDAVLLNTDGMGAEEAAAFIIGLIKERGGVR